MNDIHRILVALLVFLLPLQTVLLLREPLVGGEKWQYGTIGVYFSDLFLLGAFFLVIASPLLRAWQSRRRIFNLQSSIFNHKSEAALAALILWSGLSVFFAPDPLLAVYFFTKLLLAAGAFLVARSLDSRGRKAVMVAFIAAAVVQSVFGITQFLTQEVPASTMLGMSAQDPALPGASVLKLESGRFLRSYGTFPHPNMLGGFLAVALLFAVASGDARRWFLAVLPNIVLGLILTFSRVAWIGAGLGLAFLALRCVTKIRPYFGDTMLLKRVIVVAVSAVVFAAVLYEQVFPRFDLTAIEREGSVSERVLSLRDAQTLIVEQPLIGVGAGNFTAALIEREPDRPVWSIQPAHNVFALVFAELGAVGFLLFIGFLGALLLPFFKSSICNPQSAILLVLLPSLLLDHWLWSSHLGVITLFFLMALARPAMLDRRQQKG